MIKTIPTLLLVLLLVGVSPILSNAQEKAQDQTPAQEQPQPPAPNVAVKRVFEKLRFPKPLYFTTAPGAPDRAYVLGQQGEVFTFKLDDNAAEMQTALTLGGQTRAGGEEGLLGLAFHPQFAANRKLYLQYTAGDRPRRNIIAQYTANEDGTLIDARSRKVIMEIPQPYGNHNGGMLLFGPDNYLYIGLGDGGGSGDPINAGQRLDTLLGKILRVDVDIEKDPTDNSKNYGIPKDNPFINTPDAMPEIWAYGLRNPWRFSFDSKTNELWIGDVGQGSFEEVSIANKGDNLGWNLYEGTKLFRKPKDTDKGPFVPPVHEYGRKQGASITGGYVYRGEKIPELQGVYIFGDYGSSNIWGLKQNPGQKPTVWLLARVPNISSFGQDPQGEIYVVSLGGTIHKFFPGKN